MGATQKEISPNVGPVVQRRACQIGIMHAMNKEMCSQASYIVLQTSLNWQFGPKCIMTILWLICSWKYGCYSKRDFTKWWACCAAPRMANGHHACHEWGNVQPSQAGYVALGRRLTQHTDTAAPPENNTPIKHTSGCHQHQDNGNSGLTWLASHTGIISMLKMSTKTFMII